MWSSRAGSAAAVQRFVFGLTTLLLVLVVAGCTFQPVYGEGETDPSVQNALRFAEPNNRLERIIYEELALRIGESSSPDAPLLTIAASSGGRELGRTSISNPNDLREVRVTAVIYVVRVATEEEEQDETIYSVPRFATANFTTNGQLMSDSFASQDAEIRAARTLAETIRLSLIGALEGKL